jgi:hypothetical protein
MQNKVRPPSIISRTSARPWEQLHIDENHPFQLSPDTLSRIIIDYIDICLIVFQLLTMSQTEEEKKKTAVQNIFGSDSDSDSEDDLLADLKSSGSDSDSDSSSSSSSSSESEDERPQKRAKVSQPKAKKKAPLAKNKSAAGRPSVESGDEYDSGGEVQANSEDEAFLASDDDLRDVANEYKREKQNFKDRRPDKLPKKPRKPKDAFDAAMQAARKPKQTTDKSDSQINNEIEAFLGLMRKAAGRDRGNVAKERPALEKLSMLNEVKVRLQKKKLEDKFLDSGVLGVIDEWISPYDSNFSLPTLQVRTTMIRLIDGLRSVKLQNLKACNIGKTLKMLSLHKQETEQNKKMIRKIISRWMRLVFAKSAKYSEMLKMRRVAKKNNLQYDSYRPDTPVEGDGTDSVVGVGGKSLALADHDDEDDDERFDGRLQPGRRKGSVPTALSFSYSRNVKRKVVRVTEDEQASSATDRQTEQLKAKLNKTMSKIRKDKSAGASKRAYSISITGQGLRK